MLDIHSLERRWLRYKLKSYLPYAAIFVSVVLLYTVYSILPLLTTPPKVKKPSEKILKKPLSSVHSAPVPVILEPSMTFMQTFQPLLVEEVDATPPVEKPRPIYPQATVPSKIPLPKQTILTPLETLPAAPTPKAMINDKKNTPPLIKRDETALNISELQDRFQANPNPNLGLFIARYHYDHGNYSDSYNYALKTNALNNKMDESWIIFSKSLIKMGKIDQARKTLQLYISQSNSESAKSLLDSLSKEPQK